MSDYILRNKVRAVHILRGLTKLKDISNNFDFFQVRDIYAPAQMEGWPQQPGKNGRIKYLFPF